MIYLYLNFLMFHIIGRRKIGRMRDRCTSTQAQQQFRLHPLCGDKSINSEIFSRRPRPSRNARSLPTTRPLDQTGAYFGKRTRQFLTELRELAERSFEVLFLAAS